MCYCWVGLSSGLLLSRFYSSVYFLDLFYSCLFIFYPDAVSLLSIFYPYSIPIFPSSIPILIIFYPSFIPIFHLLFLFYSSSIPTLPFFYSIFPSSIPIFPSSIPILSFFNSYLSIRRSKVAKSILVWTPTSDGPETSRLYFALFCLYERNIRYFPH